MAKNSMKPQIRFKGFTDAWEQRKLGSMVYRTNEMSDIDGLPRVEYEDIEAGQGTLNKDLKEKVSTKKGIVFQYGDILYGKLRPYLKNWLFAWFSGIAVGDFWVLRSNLVSHSFIYRLVQTPAFDYIANQSTGSKMPRADWNLVSNSEFTLPLSTEEQEAIGQIFLKLDNLITLHQRKYEKFVNMKKALLEKMFPQGDEKVPRIRFKGFTDAWEQRKLGDIAIEVNRTDANSNAPIMMITANDGFIEQSERYAFNNAGESLKRYIVLQKGELAYNHGASKLRPYGSCFSLINQEKARIPFVYHCFSVEKHNPEFVSIELNGNDVERQLRRIVSSGARMDGLLNISFQDYASISVLLPKKAEQDKIASAFRNLDNLTTLHQRQVEKLKNIKSALLEKMFV